MLSLSLRQQLIHDTAKEMGILSRISRQEAQNWKMEWHRILRVMARKHDLHNRIVAPNIPKKVAKKANARVGKASRSLPLPAEMAIPGTWVIFCPHSRYRRHLHQFQIVTMIPVGANLADLLSADQLASLDRHTSQNGCMSRARVLVSRPTCRRLVGSLKAVLAGELAAQGRVCQPPNILDCGRLSSPLPAGAECSWAWHSPHGVATLSATVICYIPADVSLERVLPGFKIPWGVHALSNQDRYLVKTAVGHRKPFLTPAAHLVEGAFLNSDNPQTEAEA
jgi:hypothetical protein